jgi:predicted nuclease with TOPRIM domain
MNPIIITTIIAAATLILAIFGAGWLNLQMLKSYLDTKIDGLRSEMNARFDTVNAEFKTVRAEIETVRSEVANLGQRVDRIERQLEAIFKPVLPKSGD